MQIVKNIILYYFKFYLQIFPRETFLLMFTKMLIVSYPIVFIFYKYKL